MIASPQHFVGKNYICEYMYMVYTHLSWCVTIMRVSLINEKNSDFEPNGPQFESEHYQFIYLLLSKVSLWMINYVILNNLYKLSDKVFGHP